MPMSGKHGKPRFKIPFLLPHPSPSNQRTVSKSLSLTSHIYPDLSFLTALSPPKQADSQAYNHSHPEYQPFPHYSHYPHNPHDHGSAPNHP